VRNFNAAAVADYALVTDRFKLAAVTFPFLGGAEDSFAEKAFLFRTKSPVVDSLRFFYFAI
jgi:hypothetical protein